MVVVENQLAVLIRQFLKTLAQTFDPILIVVRFGSDFDWRRQFVHRLLLALAAFDYFENEQTRHAHRVTGRILELFTFGDSLGNAIECFVGVIFGKWAATPFEEANEVAADLEVLLAPAIAVVSESD